MYINSIVNMDVKVSNEHKVLIDCYSSTDNVLELVVKTASNCSGTRPIYNN